MASCSLVVVVVVFVNGYWERQLNCASRSSGGGGGFAGCVRVLIDCLNVCVCVHHVYNNPHRLMMIEYYASSSRVCTCEDAHHHISTPRPR